MTPIQRYLAEEVALDHADGLIPRREALRRLTLLGLGLPAATALLAACGAPEEPAATPSPASPAPTTTPSASPAGPSPLPTEAITFAGPDGGSWPTWRRRWASWGGAPRGRSWA
jgi:carboxymethylenebutenolidase